MDLTYFVLFHMIIYLPFHWFEEAVGDFPKWMYKHKWLPHDNNMTYRHWMADNMYYSLLIPAVLLAQLSSSLICLEAGILIWEIIDFGNHMFYTIKEKKGSPGIISASLFLINSVSGLKSFILSAEFSIIQLILGVLIGAILFAMPFGLCFVASRRKKKEDTI